MLTVSISTYHTVKAFELWKKYWQYKDNHINYLTVVSYITELLEMVLQNNYFEFNDKCYPQVSCTAMGTKPVFIC